jgi:hypothetical protein
MMLVTLQQARDHLRSDDTADNNDLTLKIHAASAIVVDYIQGPGIDGFTDSAGDVLLDSNGEPLDVPYAVQAATLLMIGYLYRLRDGDADKEFSQGYLPFPVMSLLNPYRDPSLA